MESRFMTRAIELAREAASLGEVPVGAVIVKDGKIIGEGYNMREQKNNALSHAETEAINAACTNLGDWRLDGCTIYVTLEPCPMCAGAIINARIKEVVFGAYDLNMGCMDSMTNLTNLPFAANTTVYGGIREDECKAILTDFFKEVRND
ncbi:MAG: nucleoside deaminase [Clostridia bacterium]|nr:nucleoside deaminase [Clostridia bacterium]